MKQVSSDNRKIAMQHQHLAKNTLFGYGKPKLFACTHNWKGKTTVKSTHKEGLKTITTEEECGYAIEAVSPYQMDAGDQTLFMVILYLMRIESMREQVGTPKDLEATGWLSKAPTLQLNTNLSELCQQMKLSPSGQRFENLQLRLKRLSHVGLTCEVTSTKVKRSWSSSLLRWELEEDVKNGNERKLNITLPAILASAAHKQGVQIHTSHDLDELLSLNKDSILLHSALSSRIRPGNSQRLKFDRLIGYMQFPEKMLLKKQRFITKKAIEDIAKSTGWIIIHEVKNEMYKFTRPQIIDEKQE